MPNDTAFATASAHVASCSLVNYKHLIAFKNQNLAFSCRAESLIQISLDAPGLFNDQLVHVSLFCPNNIMIMFGLLFYTENKIGVVIQRNYDNQIHIPKMYHFRAERSEAILFLHLYSVFFRLSNPEGDITGVKFCFFSSVKSRR